MTIPNREEVLRVLKTVTLLIRTSEKEGKRLFAIDSSKLDIYNTDITNHPSVVRVGDEVRGLKLRLIWRARVPTNGRWAGDPRVTVEDIFWNISPSDLTPGTFVEVAAPGMIDIEDDSKLGVMWRPFFVLYDKE